MKLYELLLKVLNFLYTKRPVVEISLDIKNKIMSPNEELLRTVQYRK